MLYCNVIFIFVYCLLDLSSSDLNSLRGHKGAKIRSLEFYPMEGYVASTSVDCTVKVVQSVLLYLLPLTYYTLNQSTLAYIFCTIIFFVLHRVTDLSVQILTQALKHFWD